MDLQPNWNTPHGLSSFLPSQLPDQVWDYANIFLCRNLLRHTRLLWRSRDSSAPHRLVQLLVGAEIWFQSWGINTMRSCKHTATARAPRLTWGPHQPETEVGHQPGQRGGLVHRSGRQPGRVLGAQGAWGPWPRGAGLPATRRWPSSKAGAKQPVQFTQQPGLLLESPSRCRLMLLTLKSWVEIC